MDRQKTVALFYAVTKQFHNAAPSRDPQRKAHSGQNLCLYIIEKHGTISQKHLAAELDIRSSSLSETIARLENKGLIKRDPSPADRRTYLISLTEAGHQEMKRIRSLRMADDVRLLEPLSDEEIETFHAILEKLSNHLKETK